MLHIWHYNMKNLNYFAYNKNDIAVMLRSIVCITFNCMQNTLEMAIIPYEYISEYYKIRYIKA